MSLLIGILVPVLAVLGLSQVTVWWFDAARGWGSAVLVAGVGAAYSLDRILDAEAHERRAALRALGPILVACAAAVAVALWRDQEHRQIVALLALLAGCYVPLKRVIPKSLITGTAWAIAVVFLPCIDMPSLTAGMPLVWCMLLITAANALLCDALDVDRDRAAGVRGLAPWLGAKWASLIAALLATLGGVLSVALGPWPLVAAAAPLAMAGVLPPSSPRRRIALDLLLVLPGVLTLCLPSRSG